MRYTALYLILTALILQSCDAPLGNLGAHCPEHNIDQWGIWELDLNNQTTEKLFFNDDGFSGSIKSFNTQQGFIFTSDGDLYRYNQSSSSSDLISRDGFSYSLSKNDQWISFTDKHETILPDSIKSDAYRGHPKLYLMNSDGTDRQLIRADTMDSLTSNIWVFTDHHRPHYLPDLNSIIHLTIEMKYEIMGENGNYELSDNPVDVNTAVYLTNVEDSNSRQRLTSYFRSFNKNYSVSDDRTMLSYVTRDFSVYLQELADSTTADKISEGKFPKFTPDNKKLLFRGVQGGMLVYNLEDDSENRILDEEIFIYSFKIFEDSKSIVFSYLDYRDYTSGIATINIDGSNHRVIVRNKHHNFDEFETQSIPNLDISFDQNSIIYTVEGNAHYTCED